MNTDNEKNAFQIQDENNKIPKAVNITAIPQMTVKNASPIISYSGEKNHRFSFRRLIIPVISVFLAFLLLSFYAEHLLSTRFSTLAKSQAEKYLATTITSATERLAAEGLLTYEKMVKTIRDPSGEVIYLEVDTGMLAHASAKLVQYIDNALCKSKSITLSVPLGSLGGWNLFSGMGFPVKARIFPIGTTYGKIYTVLEDCGINQTRHLIRVDITAKLHLVLPRDQLEVETSISLPLGERVLVGDVPEIYLDTIGGT